MSNVAETIHTVNFDDALLAAVDRARAAHPLDTARILRGLSLVEADAVTDMTALHAGEWQVRSAREPQKAYTVLAGGAGCTCPDWTRGNIQEPGYRCKHGWAVLLVRAARRDSQSPRLRQAYHLGYGMTGTCRYLANGKAAFYPGTSSAGAYRYWICDRQDLSVGPCVHATGRPDEGAPLEDPDGDSVAARRP